MNIAVSATTLNFVAFLEDPELRDWIASQADELVRRHASRTVVLDACASGNVSGITSSRTPVGEQTECENLRVGAADLEASALRSIVCDLLVPNVRTALLWAGARLADERLRALGTLSEVVVVDSSHRRTDEGALRELSATADERLEPLLRDLAYMRLEGWQDLVALFFDDPQLAGELSTISRVRVKAGSLAEAYYLIAWLASRLEWRARGKNAFSNQNGGAIHVEIEQQQAAGISGIELDSQNCRFRVCLDDDTPELACLSVTGSKHRVKRCAPLRHEASAALLHRAVLRPERGDVFEDVFRMVRSLLEEN